MKKTGLLLVLFICSISLYGQMDDRIYKIRLVSLQGQVIYEKFDKVRKYGVLEMEPSENGFTRVYLGTYIGKNTAQRVLNLVKRKGFQGAYLILDDELYDEDSPKELLYYTFQITALKKLDNSKILSGLDAFDQALVHVRYHNGFYKYSLGLYNPATTPNAERDYRELAYGMGFDFAFPKQITK
jgi:hypothetical protein